MANFVPSKKEAKDFNNGVAYVGENKALGIQGDMVQAETINNLVESSLYSQEKAELAQSIADGALTVANEALDKAEHGVGGDFVTLDTEQEITGKKEFTGYDIFQGEPNPDGEKAPKFAGIRLKKGDESFGARIAFGDSADGAYEDFAYIEEDEDDHLKIYASAGIDIDSPDFVTCRGEEIATQEWVKKNSPKASATTFGGVKVYQDEQGHWHIDTE